ncbi:transmembrane protein 242 [Nematostella vectensis]|uniref:transmembrane protein 242 n=1 Tax=Nematostella vectensis TaxID=45351 RepID=UPI002076F0E9|nr:transmembrane protein 242 [Nematostella vectensis]
MADEMTTSPENTIGTPRNPPVSFGNAAYISCVTFASMIGGFGLSLGMARRRNPDAFVGGQNEGVKLASRALAWGTVYAFTGVGAVVLGVKTALGVKDAKEFGDKMKSSTFFEKWRLPRDNGINAGTSSDTSIFDSSQEKS